MKKKMIILLAMLILLFAGCRETQSEKQTKEEVFQGVETLISEEQINLHFAWKNQRFEEEQGYTIELWESTENQPTLSILRSQLVKKNKLGFSVKIIDNIIKLEDLYFSPNREEFSPHLKTPIENAKWKLVPLLDDYRIYIDDYYLGREDYDEETEKWRKKIKQLPLFKIVDDNSGYEFLYTLNLISKNPY